MRSVTSANVACGFHAGDPAVMRATVRLARDAGVAVGAHPGFPDLVGFGRRELNASPREIEDLVLYQIGALAAIARSEGVALAHVKPHGALYNMAARDRKMADAIARAIRELRPGARPLRASRHATSRGRTRRRASRWPQRALQIGLMRLMVRWRRGHFLALSSTTRTKSSAARCAWCARAR